MKDYNDDFNEMNEIPVSDNSSDIGSENIYSAQNNEEVPESVEAQTYEDIAGSSEEPKAAPESSSEFPQDSLFSTIQVPQNPLPARQIDRITVFWSDNTYQEFFAKE